MNVFVIGATGFVGGALARHLAGRGHAVSGLARTDTAAAALDAGGIIPVAADLETRRPATVEAARRADAVIYAAQADPAQETATVGDLTRALAGTGKTLLFLSGSGVLLQRTEGAWSQDVFAEDDPFIVEPLAEFRKAAEDTVLAAAADGVRAMVVRPGLIWGPGDHGQVPMIYQSVAATGAACYIGPGLNAYSHVHIDDVTRLFTLAIETGRAGGLYHAVAGEVPNRWIAERVAADLGVEARSITPAEAPQVWGRFGALIMAASSRLRAVTARRELGWEPAHTDMLSMIGEPRLRRLAHDRPSTSDQSAGEEMSESAEPGTDYRWLPAGFTVHDVDTNGTTISAAVGGGGPTMVLLHGWPQTGRAWRHVMGQLAEHYTVVVPDLRGSGASARPESGYRKTNQAKDMQGVLQGLGLSGPSVVVGHDIGAMVAFAWAAAHPEEVAALVTIDVIFPGLGLEESMDVAQGGMWHFGFFMQPHIPEMLFDGHELEFFTATFTALSNPGTFTDEDLAFYARAYQGRERLSGGFSQYRDLLEDGRENRTLLQNQPLTMPVLAIGGGDRTGSTVAEALRPYAPRLTGLVAPTGHFVVEEDPDWFLRALIGFLDDRPASN